MVRIRIPNGMMTSHQLRAIADLTRRHANGIADLTVRQNIQLHWVTIESLPEVLDGLWQVGLNTTGACGDVTRNVTGCPVAGVDADEIVDASPLVLETRSCWPEMQTSTICRASSRFPSRDATRGARIPRSTILASLPSRVTSAANPKLDFSLRVAGGLSAEPYLGARLNAFVRWNQVFRS